MNRPGKVRASVTCVVPGLVWPGDGLEAHLGMAGLDALATLFGKGSVSRTPAVPFLDWLGGAFGSSTPLPWAAYRMAGEQERQQVTEGESVLCADPVSLSFTRDALLLGSPGGLHLSENEAATLVAYLNEHFADLGYFGAASPERWYLRTKNRIDARFHPLADVVGRPVAYFQPEGENARFWARTLNEIQVALYNHPINQTRLEQGRPTANGVWFWGEAAASPRPALCRPADTVVSSDPLMLGLARASGANAVDESSASPSHGRAGKTWWHDGTLAAASQEGDLAQWSAALLQVETKLLQPLLEAWQAGRIQSLSIMAPSDKTLLEIRLDATSRWKFWRTAAKNTDVLRQIQTPVTANQTAPSRSAPQ